LRQGGDAEKVQQVELNKKGWGGREGEKGLGGKEPKKNTIGREKINIMVQ